MGSIYSDPGSALLILILPYLLVAELLRKGSPLGHEQVEADAAQQVQGLLVTDDLTTEKRNIRRVRNPGGTHRPARCPNPEGKSQSIRCTVDLIRGRGSDRWRKMKKWSQVRLIGYYKYKKEEGTPYEATNSLSIFQKGFASFTDPFGRFGCGSARSTWPPGSPQSPAGTALPVPPGSA